MRLRLLIVRHGAAGDREQFATTGRPDELRPLTKAGKRDVELVTRGLRRIIPAIDTLATSPLVRARQTAEIIAGAYDIPVVETAALEPDAPFSDFVQWAEHGAKGDVTAIVGHEPHLSGLIAWLIGAGDEAHISLKKSGACLLRFDTMAAQRGGTLLWLATPKLIRG